MIPKKLHFLIYILLVISLQSCKKDLQKKPRKQSNLSQINRLLEIGHKHYCNQQYDSSYYYYNQAKYAAEIKKDTSRTIHSLGWMAQIQQNQGDYTGSEITSTEALPYIENSNSYPYGQTNIYIVLGNNYLNTFDNDNAIFYFKKAINSKTDEVIKAGIINNISIAYAQKGDYQKAIEILLPLTLKKEIINDPKIYSQTLSNIGYIYNKTNNSKAINFHLKSLKISLKSKEVLGIASSYYNLSNYYKERNPNLAIKYGTIAYQEATKLNSVDDRLGCLKLLIEITKGSQLKKYSVKYVKINDSITKVRQQAKNQFAKMKYDSKKEKEEILNLKAQKAENALELQLQKSTTLNLYVIVGIILTITGFIYFYLIEKSKREKSKTSYDTEVRIAKKLHDELANDVYQTMVFAETQDLSSSYNKEMLLDNLDTIYSRTRNISKENSFIPMGPDFISSLQEMISGFDTEYVNILIYGVDTINWSTIIDIKKITIYRVLQEFLINMKKHSEASLVVLSFKKYENNLQLDYTDNGVGAAIEKLNLKNGLQNVENRILAIKGTITFDTKPGKGFKSSITFPL
ncbi:Tetratricopeptide repeat-containing protein [Flavobacterium frigoris]|uniref:Tetratricopeptide repeat-containing protein n=2 Tax=Flavobacterium frigoris TaxID=229204 RepID=A0A1H9RKX7_FLAFI|nr:Tetratricopeptide repeat-containing protein [Flavobacterium frigoris]